ncbi:MAG: M24 family metallopeptidase, partial [Hoeflea sp. D1-CHI-28]
KDTAEMERLREATRVAELGFQAGLAVTKVGNTENDVAGEIERAIRRAGSTWAWAVTGGTEVGIGPRTAFRHGVSQQSTDRKIVGDEFLILDIHTLIDLYMADFALPVFYGTPTSEQTRMIDAWEATIDTLFDTFRPGVPVADCARAAHARFEKAGYGDLGLPLFGHGLGTCARARPFINMTSTDTVQEGMVVALGCHLYVPGEGGMRLEFPAFVDRDGLKPFGEMPPRVVRKTF